PLGPLPLTVTYHDACHLAHGQRVRQAPRALLRRIPGLTLVELGDSDLCCGSAGVYNLLEPALARELLALKVARIVETGARVGGEEQTLEAGDATVARAGLEHGLVNDGTAPLLVLVVVAPPPPHA